MLHLLIIVPGRTATTRKGTN